LLATARGIDELPDDLAVGADFQDSTAVRLDDQRVAVVEPLLFGPDGAVKRLLASAAIRPDDFHALGIEFDHPRDTGVSLIICIVVEEQNIAVRERVGVMLPD